MNNINHNLLLLLLQFYFIITLQSLFNVKHFKQFIYSPDFRLHRKSIMQIHNMITNEDILIRSEVLRVIILVSSSFYHYGHLHYYYFFHYCFYQFYDLVVWCSLSAIYLLSSEHYYYRGDHNDERRGMLVMNSLTH